MKIELIKETEADGKTWWMIYVDGSCKKSFGGTYNENAEKEARECYQKAIENGAWNKKETVESIEI